MDTASTEKAPAGGNTFAKRLLAFIFGGALLYFAFRGCDFASVWHYAQRTNLFYIALMCVTCLISHLLRAWRWIYLLEPLENRRVSLWNSFCAVILGYAINVPIPRGGEIARLVSISKSEKLPWAGVLSTMFIDRMLDLVLLGLLLGVTLTSLPPALTASNPWVVPGGATIALGSLVGLFVLPWMGRIIRLVLANQLVSSKLPQTIAAKLDQLATQFEVGTRSLFDTRALPMIALLTPAIWFCYWLNLYLTLCAFDLHTKLTLMQTLVVFTMASVSVLVPAPGSVGSYHFILSQALAITASIDKDLALAVASVGHLFSFIVVPCITAPICVGLQSMKMGAPAKS